jgi:hypothetical protein
VGVPPTISRSAQFQNFSDPGQARPLPPQLLPVSQYHCMTQWVQVRVSGSLTLIV